MVINVKQVSGKTFWNNEYKNKTYYKPLTNDEYTDILIIGGGITGAISAYYLSKSDKKITLVEKNLIGMSSTRATTALLEYQIDKLLKDDNSKKIVDSFHLCFKAIEDIKKICKDIKCDCKIIDCVLFTNYDKKKKLLKEEKKIRKKQNFDVTYSDKDELIKVKGILRSKNASIIINPYEFTCKLIEYLKDKINIYENTNILNIVSKNNYHYCLTNNDNYIKTKNVIWCNGFDFSVKGSKLYKTFAIVTKPVKKLDNCFTGKDLEEPYNYIRFTEDNRIIYGGEDILYKKNFDNLDKLNIKANKKYKKLFKRLVKLFPNKNLELDFCYNGTFANTKDTLPIIDEIKPNVYCNLGFGANGVLYSVLGAKYIYNKILLNKKLPTNFKIR